MFAAIVSFLLGVCFCLQKKEKEENRKIKIKIEKTENGQKVKKFAVVVIVLFGEC